MAWLFLASHDVQAAYRDELYIFLSHSFKDAELMLGVKRLLVKTRKPVYVDRIIAQDIDRGEVNGGQI